MNYAQLRSTANTGDVLMVAGTGVFSRLIRVSTGNLISHVAVLLWLEDTLWVAEMKEGAGYRMMPASAWVNEVGQSADIYYGRAPDNVRNVSNQAALKYIILHHRDHRYGWASLLRVWWNQFLPGYRRTWTVVCSTFVGRVWAHVGFKMDTVPTPGTFMRLCTIVTKLSV